MDDNEIHNLIDDKLKDTCERFDKSFKVLTEFIAGENQGIKKSIDSLTLKVEQQNGSVRVLKEWKAGIEGAEKQKSHGFDNTLKILGFIVAFSALIGSVYFGYHKTRKDVVNMLDQYSFDITTRSWVFNKDSI